MALLEAGEDKVVSLQVHCTSCHTMLSTSTDNSGLIVAWPRQRETMQNPHGSAPIATRATEPQADSSAKPIEPTASISGGSRFWLAFALFLPALVELALFGESFTGLTN